MACKYCHPKASVLFYHQPLHHSLHPNHNHFPWCFTTEPQAQTRDGRGTKDKISMYLGNCGLYLALFWYVHFAPSGHFHSKYVKWSDIFAVAFREAAHALFECGNRETITRLWLKPHLQICIQIHQPQEAFLFYTPLICVITLTKLT